MKYVLTFLIISLVPWGIYSQAVISRHNIHIGEKKLERNQAKPDTIEAERRSRSLEREARILQQILEEGDTESREYREGEGKPLFTNGIWRFVINSSDTETGLSKIEYKLNSSPVLTYRSPIRISSPGWNSIEYRGIDRVGNQEDWRLTRIFRDVNPPLVSWNLKGNHYQVGDKYFITPDTKVEVNAVDRESGLRGIYFQENGSTWKLYPESGYVLPESRSSNNSAVLLHVRALDNVNNRSVPIRLSLELIHRVPEPTVHVSRFLERDGVKYCSQNSKFSFTKTQSALAETIYYKTSDTPEWREFVSGEIRPSASKNGEKRTRDWSIEYKTTNALNQESQVMRWTCRIDVNPPQTEILRKGE